MYPAYRLSRLVFAALFLIFFIGCAKEYRPASLKDLTCMEEADQAIQRGDYELGVRLHLDFLKKEPENALAMYHVGYAYGMAGNHAKEIEFYENAIATGYNLDADFYYNMGMAYAELGSFEKAKSAFKKALEINPHHAEAREVLGSLEKE